MSNKQTNKMKVTIQEVLSIDQGLEKLSNVALDARSSFNVYSIKTAVSEHVTNYRSTVNDLIVKKYGEKVEGSENFKVPQKNQPEYLAQLSKLLAKTVNLKAEPLKLSELSEAKLDFKFFELMGGLVVND